mgnify:CR=1 FL=1
MRGASRPAAREHTLVAAPQRQQASPQQSQSKLCLCIRLALLFVTKPPKARNEVDAALNRFFSLGLQSAH